MSAIDQATGTSALLNLESHVYIDKNMQTFSRLELAWKRFVCWISRKEFDTTPLKIETVAYVIYDFIKTIKYEEVGKESLEKIKANLTRIIVEIHDKTLVKIVKGTYKQDSKKEAAKESLVKSAGTINSYINVLRIQEEPFN